MGSLRVSTQEAAQKITRKITMEAQNIGEEIERIQLKLPITLTKEQEEQLQGILSAIKNAVGELKETRVKQQIIILLKGKLPVKQGIAVLSSYLSTLQNYISESIATSNEAIDDWVEIEDINEGWDMLPEGERMLVKQKRMETRKTKNQMMRELLEAERKR